MKKINEIEVVDPEIVSEPTTDEVIHTSTKIAIAMAILFCAFALIFLILN